MCGASSGCNVTPWIPYAWKHSVADLWSAWKLLSWVSETVMCAEARVFCWFRRQTCSS